ncbi:MAG: aminodeoxychorismate synthase, component I [Flavobacteriia bacterium]|nr:MAG: aminodeoxychorismate synthase, component I [Flavobacteriia bacterium]
MRRINKRISLDQLPAGFLSKLWFWVCNFDTVQWLDTNNYENAYTSYKTVVALGAHSVLKTDYKGAFDQWQRYYKKANDYIFGFLGYDLKNDLEDLESSNPDGLDFPDMFFFQPKKLLFITDTYLETAYLEDYAHEWEQDLKSITQQQYNRSVTPSDFTVHQRMDFRTYSGKFEQLQAHINRGDTYETNFCMEFYAEDVTLDPHEVFRQLNRNNPMPFAAFIKHGDYYVMSASPERFAGKKGNKIFTQPIKGTRKRGRNKDEDTAIIKELESNTKERSENIMIVDLVRNDLSRIAEKNSVNVEELCKIYTFPNVHQMISTVTCRVAEKLPVVEVIKALFPMGSMTGAPKISTMKIIDALEMHKRSLYSGAIGYVSPQGDFDFSVVIRTMLYNAKNRYLSMSVGGAITAKAEAEAEYEECLLKAEALLKTLEVYKTKR